MTLHQESFKIENAGAGSTPFTVIQGGKYLFAATATFGGGTVKVQVLTPDNSTYVDVWSLTAAGVAAIDIAPGAYKFLVTTASAVYASLSRCPY